MSIDQAFLPWVEGKGVKLKGVEPRVLPGRGIGVVATRDVRVSIRNELSICKETNDLTRDQANEAILTVPTRALRTIDTVPKRISEVLQGVSVHGILAAEIALDDSEDYGIWKTVLPTREDLEGGMPMMWPSQLQSLLPQRARDILNNQTTTFRRECDIVLRSFPKLTRHDYLYSWVLINTRTFYNSMPRMQTYAKADRLVCMPAADLFNHADQGCQLSYSAAGYNIITDRIYKAGEEVFLSYGSHSNDFLLAEYGFILDTNRWDEVYLDDVILPRLSKTQRSDLETIGFLGRYTLDEQTLGCHRTQVALRMLCCTQRQWQRFYQAEDDGRSSQGDVNELLLTGLEDYVETIHKTLQQVDEIEGDFESQRESLRRRWQQIEAMVKKTIDELK